MRNTGFIVAGTIICLCVEHRQVVEEFIDQLMVFRGGFRAGRVSGRHLCPKTEVFQYLSYYLLVSNKIQNRWRGDGEKEEIQIIFDNDSGIYKAVLAANACAEEV